MAGLYIHVPFCSQACHYCDFHFSTSRGNLDAMVIALCGEIELQRTYLDLEPIETIYFGGGTPSLLSEEHLRRLMDTIYKNFKVENAEIRSEEHTSELQSQSNLVC